jgi:hypothetical protein
MTRNPAKTQDCVVKKEDVRLTVTLCMIVASFIICWTPVGLVFMMIIFDLKPPHFLLTIVSLPLLLNTLVDPIILIFRLKSIREEFFNTFCCCKC